MDHRNALETRASERYLLGEMREQERFEFEAHYFSCETCADDVRAGVALERAMKAELGDDDEIDSPRERAGESPPRGWYSWLTAPGTGRAHPPGPRVTP